MMNLGDSWQITGKRSNAHYIDIFEGHGMSFRI